MNHRCTRKSLRKRELHPIAAKGPSGKGHEVIYAYVGTGQAVNLEENAALVYKGALQQARNRRNEQAVKELESIAPYPPANPDLRKMMIANKWAGNLAPQPPSGLESRKFPSIVSVVLSTPKYSSRR